MSGERFFCSKHRFVFFLLTWINTAPYEIKIIVVVHMTRQMSPFDVVDNDVVEVVLRYFGRFVGIAAVVHVEVEDDHVDGDDDVELELASICCCWW